MENRRQFLRNIGSVTGGALVAKSVFAAPAIQSASAKAVRFGFITDLHHLQFGKREEIRMKAFMDAVLDENPDFIIQNGDFSRHTDSDQIMTEWNRFSGPKYHVLGNHDMDFCDKDTIMKFWNMPDRFYSFDKQGFHFVVMDRNFLRKEDGSLVDYNTSNWGPYPSPNRSFTDQLQLDWLRNDLSENELPVVVFMHQPVFLSDFFQEIGNAEDILSIFDSVNLRATNEKKKNRVVAVFMGHDHDDRHGSRNDVHYFIMNSASYVYTKGGAYYYKDPLYAFVTLDPSGKVIIEGKSTVYRDPVPDVVRARFPTKISDHHVDF